MSVIDTHMDRRRLLRLGMRAGLTLAAGGLGLSSL